MKKIIILLLITLVSCAAPKKCCSQDLQSLLKFSTFYAAVNGGTMIVEFLSGDPSQNVFALFPFYLAAGIGTLVGILYLTKRRS